MCFVRDKIYEERTLTTDEMIHSWIYQYTVSVVYVSEMGIGLINNKTVMLMLHNPYEWLFLIF